MNMLKQSTLAVALTGLFATALLAQSVVVPNSFSTKAGGTAYGIPFSYAAYVRHQQLIDASQINVGSITGLAFRARTPTTLVNVPDRAWQEMWVQLSHSGNTLSTMGTNYAGNHGKDVTTVFNGKMDCYKLNAGAPLEFNVVVPFSAPFLFLKTAPLVVDLYPQNNGFETNTGCGGGNGTSMDFTTTDTTMRYVTPAKAAGGCNNTPPNTMSGQGTANGGFVLKLFYGGDLLPYGRASAGTGGVFPIIGSSGGGAKIGNSTFQIDLAGGPSNGTGALLIIGASNRLDNTTRLPVNLTKLGLTTAKDCWQETNILFAFFRSMGAGKASFPAGIPNNTSLRGLEVFTQWAVDDPTLGSFTTTQGGLIRIQ